MHGDAFRENVVVITGGSAGIGREIAYQLAAQGAWLVLAAREAALLEETAREARNRGARAVAVPTDVAVETQCQALIERAVGEYGRIDTLINNAGISMYARFDELGTVEPLERVMQINYFGSIYCTHYALPHLKKSRGRIVVVSSLAAKTGVPMRSAYAASKHAMAGFFDSLRIELAEDGVSVTVVYPGFVATEIATRRLGPDGKVLGSQQLESPDVMPVEECARQIIELSAGRGRELVMTRRARLGQWLRLVAPGMVDGIAARAIERRR
jgi:NAD(P)-dependent dehydrogenase (short-subunit alcohol dehydrogenase family)